jgi:hypothetical protein
MVWAIMAVLGAAKPFASKNTKPFDKESHPYMQYSRLRTNLNRTSSLQRWDFFYPKKIGGKKKASR